MKLTIKLWVLFFGVLMLGNVAHAQSPREELQQMVEQLQKTPNDNALREKIIKLASSVKPAPVIPEEARRSFVRGNTAFSEAKGLDDYARAVQRYEEALVIAPWWGDAYFNLAKALEQRQEYSRAIQTIKLFVLTGPAADEARKAQDYSYALEDKQEKLTKEKSKQEAAARAEETKYGWLTDRWSVTMGVSKSQFFDPFPVTATREGDSVVLKSQSTDLLRATIKDGKTSWEFWRQNYPNRPASCPIGPSWVGVAVDVSADRRRLTFQTTSYGTHSCESYGYHYYYADKTSP